ncbi:MAG TPA: zf-TFIIB domain-containing protein [Holophaga sp.]|mgnify:CR=1 FL=1|nr:zf-TFIIB domain-containing protein [Holophaga sp.]HPS67884.1 zf-TFIIB domain-containing protein [Holophaga sp.]
MPVKPTTREEEFFAKQEFERRRKAAQELEKHLASQELVRLKELHWMRCPKDGMELVEVEFHGVKVDQCSHCGGVFLDAGEMDDVAAAEKGGFLSSLGSFFKG